MRLALLVVCTLSLSCVKRAPDGTVLRRVPSCGAQGKSVRAKPLDEAVHPCMRLLSIEPVDSSRTLLGLSTDADGRIAQICLVGSTHEADSRFLNCLVDQLERTSPVLPPNQKTLVWTVNVSY